VSIDRVATRSPGSYTHMPRRPSVTRRWLTALTWPAGIGLTSWDYLWRTTVMHRAETVESDVEPHLPPPVPEAVDRTEIQPPQDGAGPLFHRRYSTKIRESPLTPEALMDRLKHNVNAAAPTKFARFQRVLGEGEALAPGDEYVVRMPGPWDGPVRVVADDDRSFRLATLAGHLEAGQIEFRTCAERNGGPPLIRFEIESWARSGGRLSDLLYQHARMAKEIQLHMWVSFLEGVVKLSGGRMTGGIVIDTRRVQSPFGE
jgi:hypothetical protein